MSPSDLFDAYRRNGCTRVLAKRLAPNDNSKNQIYLGGDYTAINLLPFGELAEDDRVLAGSVRSRLKASVDFRWLVRDGSLHPAPQANLILYPKYPEVRLSGMLAGAGPGAPSDVIPTRDEGRWLILGITPAGVIVGYACNADAPVARWAEENAPKAPRFGVFLEFPLVEGDFRRGIQDALRTIAEKGWIRSKRLNSRGEPVSSENPNSGGYTLEAELGIKPNGRADPDYDGWEVKQFGVDRLEDPRGGRITLFTPEPDAGFYKEGGFEAFMRKYGYPDKKGRADRTNFGGAHLCNRVHALTGMRLTLSGWDATERNITSLDGGIHLLDPTGYPAAIWSFSALINHWARKHAKTVYVPSLMRTDPRQYRYGFRVLAGIGTEFPLFLDAVSAGNVIYDPALKIVDVEGAPPKPKKRNQFRITFRNIPALYTSSEWWELGQPAE